MAETPVLKSFDRVAHIYDETRGLPERVETALADAIVDEVRAEGRTPRLFECGIGTGRIAAPVAARGVRVAGTDIAPKMLERLRAKRGDIDVALAEAASPPFRAASFDGAVFFHILHLVPDRAATVRATMSLVRRGGAVRLCNDRHVPGSLGERVDEVMERIMREETTGVKGGRDLGEEVEADFLRAVTEAGARIERRIVAMYPEPSSGRRIIDALVNREHSGAWVHTDAEIATMARRASAELPPLLGSLDAPFDFEHELELVTAHIPAQ
jgi:ubiquinone/menaquinone biosynthesis C-methylase UbiE